MVRGRMESAVTIGSLFSGIGGLELGLEWVGLGPVKWQVENEPFCRSVLAKHWPEADRSVTDVCAATRSNLAPVDLICGGFPCQDLSYAGKGAGLAGARSGLWREYARIVGEIRPRFVVVENVSALLGRGASVVLGDLARLGYDAVWTTVRASDVGAPHRRERLFIVAYRGRIVVQRDGSARDVPCASSGSEIQGRERQRLRDSACDGGQVGVAHADSLGECEPQHEAVPESRSQPRQGAGERGQPNVAHSCGSRLEGRRRDGERADERVAWQTSNPGPIDNESGVFESRVGLSASRLPQWVARWPSRPGETQRDWEAPRVVGKCDNRAARLKALGNAVVPQVAYVVGMMVRKIMESQ